MSITKFSETDFCYSHQRLMSATFKVSHTYKMHQKLTITIIMDCAINKSTKMAAIFYLPVGYTTRKEKQNSKLI